MIYFIHTYQSGHGSNKRVIRSVYAGSEEDDAFENWRLLGGDLEKVERITKFDIVAFLEAR